MFRQSTTSRTLSPHDELVAGALPDRVQIARERLEHQYDPALLEALSERELAQDRELAELVRAHQRDEQRARIRAAADAADRVRATAASLADREAADLLRAAQAIGEQRHSSSPHAKVARLHQRKPRVLALFAGVVGFSMLFSAVTVQQNIAPGMDTADPMFWLSYGLEALISAVLVGLMISTADTSEYNVLSKEKLRQVYLVEVALLLTSIGLNTFPYVRDGDLAGFGVHVIAPVMIGVALISHRLVAERYGRAIEQATAAIPDHEDLQARLVALTQVGDAANGIVPAILAPADAAQERSTAAQQSDPAQQLALTTEHEHSAEPRRGATDEVPCAAQQTAVAEQSTPATTAEQNTVQKTSGADDDSDPVTDELPVLHTTDHAAAQHPATAASPAAQPTADDAFPEAIVVVDDEVAIAAPATASHADPAPTPTTVESDVVVATSEAARSRGSEQFAQHRAVQHPATATSRSVEQRSNTAEHERSIIVDTEQPAQHVRSTGLAAEQRGPAAQHPAEQSDEAEPGEIPAEVWEVAGAVKDATQSRSDVERIATALAHHDATGDAPSRVARDLHMGFKSVEKWLSAASEIRRERAGARVIHLHNN